MRKQIQDPNRDEPAIQPVALMVRSQLLRDAVDLSRATAERRRAQEATKAVLGDLPAGLMVDVALIVLKQRKPSILGQRVLPRTITIADGLVGLLLFRVAIRLEGDGELVVRLRRPPQGRILAGVDGLAEVELTFPSSLLPAPRASVLSKSTNDGDARHGRRDGLVAWRDGLRTLSSSGSVSWLPQYTRCLERTCSTDARPVSGPLQL